MISADLRLLPDGSVAGQFLHGVDLTNDMTVNNLRVDGRLWTPDIVGLADPGLAETYRPIGDISIEELAAGGPAENVVSPRVAAWFIPAAILAQGQIIVDGYGVPKDISESRKKRILETRDIELAFEGGRRQYAPEAPSRLSCIWLVENSSAGRGVISWMLPKAYIANVRIQFCTGIRVADASWYDDYFNYAKPEYIKNYWTGMVHPNTPRPEILVGGIVQFIEPDQLKYIKKYGNVGSGPINISGNTG